MRVLRSATNTSQKVLIGTNNCMSKPIRATKLKKSANNAKSDSKQVQRVKSSFILNFFGYILYKY